MNFAARSRSELALSGVNFFSKEKVDLSFGPYVVSDKIRPTMGIICLMNIGTNTG